MIEFKNVSKTYSTGTEAVHEASFKIDKGDFAFLVGQSGSGKSTLIKLIFCTIQKNVKLYSSESAIESLRKQTQ